MSSTRMNEGFVVHAPCASRDIPECAIDVLCFYRRCTKCGYLNHQAATVVDSDDKTSCNKCYHVFSIKES